MSLKSTNQKFLAFVLGFIVLTKSSSTDYVESSVENDQIIEENCNGLFCGDTGKNIKSQSEDNLQDVKNSDPSADNEKIIHFPDNKEQVHITSTESPRKQESTGDVKHGFDDSAIAEESFPHTVADVGSSVKNKEPTNTDSTENSTSLTHEQGSTNSNADDEHDAPTLEVIGMKKIDRFSDASTHHAAKSEPAKHTLFPFLYTSLFTIFKSLVHSFLSEFVDQGNQQDVMANVTEGTNQSLLISDGENSLNITFNNTDSLKKTRFQCAFKNVTEYDIGKVKVVNSTELLDILSLSKTQKSSACVLVMFYAPWCHFCAQTAPHYNALARAFPQLDILAVDTSHFSYLNARFGTVAVPNIMLFHSRSAVRFNHTQRVLEKFTHFVTNNTGLEPRRFVLLEPLDFVGPLPCVVKQNRDWLLWLAWVFVTICSSYGFVQSQYGQSFIARLKVLWQEHQHID